MASGMKRMAGLSLLVLGVAYLSSPKAEAGLLGNAVIRGKITGQIGGAAAQPISGAKVLVEIDGVVGSKDATIQFFGSHQIVYTASDGTYQATVGIPDDIPINHLIFRVRAAKLSGPTIYGAMEARGGLSPGIFTYQANLTLQGLTYGAFISGTIRSQETGQRMRGAGVQARRPNPASGGTNTTTYAQVTDGDADFFGVIQMNGAAEVQSVSADTNDLPYLVDTSPDGLAYNTGLKWVTLNSGKLHTVNVDLTRDATRPSIVGRVIDGSTGKPRPHVVVRLTNGVASYSVTDELGRYALPVQFPVSYPIIVETTGTFLDPDDRFSGPPSPYWTDRVNLSGRLQDGQVFQLDLSMVRK